MVGSTGIILLAAQGDHVSQLTELSDLCFYKFSLQTQKERVRKDRGLEHTGIFLGVSKFSASIFTVLLFL